MYVWLVYTEYQSGDPAIIGVFRKRKAARHAVTVERKQQEGFGHIVFGPANDAEWDVDIHLEKLLIQ